MSNKNVLWCDEKTLAQNLEGKVYIVTGANSGVGLETTRQLVKQGAHVVMACRRVEAAENAVSSNFDGLKGSAEILPCDLADLGSVRAFVDKFLARNLKLDGLVCNAGLVMMENRPQYTKDGFEMTWAVSYFGHFLLVERLLNKLKESESARICLLSSVVHAGSEKNRYQVYLDDLHYQSRKFNNFAAYGEAKVAVVQYALELADRLKDTNVTAFSIHPGWARSNFGGNGALMKIMRVLMYPFRNSITNSNEESAQTTLHCLLSEDANNYSGAYFSQHSVLYSDKECKKGGWPMRSPNPHANDLAQAQALVAVSHKLVGLA